MTEYKKMKLMGIAALLTQWVVCMVIPLGLNYYFLYNIAPIFWLLLVSYPLTFWLIRGGLYDSKIKFYFFKIPKTVVTDYGYTYAHFGIDALMDMDSNYPYNLYLYSNKLFYWEVEAKDKSLEKEKYYDIDYMKDKINFFHHKKLYDNPKKNISFKKWNGIATERKEILRDVTIDRVLND